MEENREVVKYAYVGVEVYRPTNDKMERLYAYIEPELAASYYRGEAEARVFKKALARCSVGAVLACTITRNGDRMTVHKVEYVERLGSIDLTLKLQSKSEAAITAIAADAARRANANKDELRETLKPLQVAYQKMSPTNKRAFLVWLWSYFTGEA